MTPNSQGIALLMQANILENFDLARIGHNTLDYVHLFVEAKKLAFADRDRYVCDPDFRSIPVEKMISKAYGKKQAGRINLKKAAARVSPTTEQQGQQQQQAATQQEPGAFAKARAACLEGRGYSVK